MENANNITKALAIPSVASVTLNVVFGGRKILWTGPVLFEKLSFGAAAGQGLFVVVGLIAGFALSKFLEKKGASESICRNSMLATWAIVPIALSFVTGFSVLQATILTVVSLAAIVLSVNKVKTPNDNSQESENSSSSETSNDSASAGDVVKVRS